MVPLCMCRNRHCKLFYLPLILKYDQTQIPDIETYEFTCPSCKDKEANKGKKSAKKSTQPVAKTSAAPQSQSTTTNKRDVKAASKQVIPAGNAGAKGAEESTTQKGGDNKKSTAKSSAPATSNTLESKSKIVLLNKAAVAQVATPQALGSGASLISKKTTANTVDVSKGINPPSMLIQAASGFQPTQSLSQSAPNKIQIGG